MCGINFSNYNCKPHRQCDTVPALIFANPDEVTNQYVKKKCVDSSIMAIRNQEKVAPNFNMYLDHFLKGLHNSEELRPYLRCPKNETSRKLTAYLESEIKDSKKTTKTPNELNINTSRTFTVSTNLQKNTSKWDLEKQMKDFYNTHDFYFINILKSIFTNTARFVPNFPKVEPDFFEKLGYVIYNRYHLFITEVTKKITVRCCFLLSNNFIFSKRRFSVSDL